MSKNKKICIFNQNHIIGKKSLINHYQKSHSKEFSNIMNNGWYCRGKTQYFKNKVEMDEHMINCKECQKYCGENLNETISISISKTSLEAIEKKLPKNKRHIDFPFFDFSKYIIPDDNQLINLESELIKELIEEEKNIV